MDNKLERSMLGANSLSDNEPGALDVMSIEALAASGITDLKLLSQFGNSLIVLAMGPYPKRIARADIAIV